MSPLKKGTSEAEGFLKINLSVSSPEIDLQKSKQKTGLCSV